GVRRRGARLPDKNNPLEHGRRPPVFHFRKAVDGQRRALACGRRPRLRSTIAGRQMRFAMPRTRTVFTAGCFAAAALAQVSRQDPTQLCPPCAAVRQAQEIPKGLAPETLVHRDWAVAERGINEAGWQQSRGAGYRLGTGATILQIDTGVTHHPLLPDLTGADADDGRPGAPPRRGVDFHGADRVFRIGYSNEDPLLSGLLRFPGHGTKTSSVIAATWPPLQPAAPPSAALIAGTLADGIDVTISYSYVYRDDVIATDALKKEGMESATVTVKPAGATRGIHVSVARSDDPLVATINVYAQDVNDPVRSLAASIPNTGTGPAGADLTTKTWDGRVPAPAAAPWRLASAGAGERMRGAAPGARLIPLRGTQGVLLIPGQLGELDTEPWRIANALDQAALGDRARPGGARRPRYLQAPDRRGVDVARHVARNVGPVRRRRTRDEGRRDRHRRCRQPDQAHEVPGEMPHGDCRGRIELPAAPMGRLRGIGGSHCGGAGRRRGGGIRGRGHVPHPGGVRNVVCGGARRRPGRRGGAAPSGEGGREGW